MVDSLHIGIFQYDICWKDITANFRKIESLLAGLKELPDILFLPEMYSTGFVMEPDKLDHKLLTGQPSKQLTLSDKYRLAIMGSLVFPEENHYYNRMVLSDAQGSMDFYDKRHLFMEENKRGLFKAGAKRKTFLVRGVEIMPQICYDLRFPVWSRNNLNYQVLVYSANWPEVRQEVWDTLLRARAIENQCYVVGINRVGVDGNGISYKGGSVVYSPKGESMLNIEDEENYSSITISLSSLSAFREKFPVYKDADSFTID